MIILVGFLLTTSLSALAGPTPPCTAVFSDFTFTAQSTGGAPLPTIGGPSTICDESGLPGGFPAANVGLQFPVNGLALADQTQSFTITFQVADSMNFLDGVLGNISANGDFDLGLANWQIVASSCGPFGSFLRLSDSCFFSPISSFTTSVQVGLSGGPAPFSNGVSVDAFTVIFPFEPTPEPGTLLLIGTGLVGFSLKRARTRKV